MKNNPYLCFMHKHGNKGKDNLITNRRKGKAQAMRTTSRSNPGGSRSTHRMEYGENPDPKSKYKYTANPTIFPDKGGEWKDLGGQGWKAHDEASKRGEVFGFKSEKRAEKFAAGSWKKGVDRREAMKSYRKGKK